MAHTGTAILIALHVVACGSTDSPDGSGAPKAEAGGSGGSDSGSGKGGGTAGSGADTNGNAGAQSGGASSNGGNTGANTGGVGIENVTACPGTTISTGPNTCRSQADCSSGAMCLDGPPTGAGACGACFPTVEQCSSDTDCDAERICETMEREPCQCMGGDRLCVAKCDASSCDDGQVCGADGRCAPQSCTEGFVCPAGTLCDPARSAGHGCAAARCDLGETACSADEVCDPSAPTPSHCRAKRCTEGVACPTNQRCNADNGACLRLPCQADADCDCGVCVLGACRERLFTCHHLAP